MPPTRNLPDLFLTVLNAEKVEGFSWVRSGYLRVFHPPLGTSTIPLGSRVRSFRSIFRSESKEKVRRL